MYFSIFHLSDVGSVSLDAKPKLSCVSACVCVCVCVCVCECVCVSV